MEAYFAFTDECGVYQRERTEKSKATHPYYVRATVIISFEDDLKLQKGMNQIKETFGLHPSQEVKWSDYGSALKGQRKRIKHDLSTEQIAEYIVQVTQLFCSLDSVCVYYSLTDNRRLGKVSEEKLIQMHLQNAFQAVQHVMEAKEACAIVIADNLNEKNKVLKSTVAEMTRVGDFVRYSNVKHGLIIDCSENLCGLQIADICAGLFTASLKYEMAKAADKHKHQFAHDTFFDGLHRKTRYNGLNSAPKKVYGFGVKNVPCSCGEGLAVLMSEEILQSLQADAESLELAV